MLHVARFTFNPFQENTFVVHNGKEAVIIDPGCWNGREQRELEDYLIDNDLTPARLILTHAHIDHILGCAWIHERFGLKPEMHPEDLRTWNTGERSAHLYGIPFTPGPAPESFLEAGDELRIGDGVLHVLFVPGHAPGHIAFHSPADRFVVSGDVLFRHSIGRVDLPGGDLDTLLMSIRDQLFPLGDEVTVHCGHGPDTTIGHERRHNPFLKK